MIIYAHLRLRADPRFNYPAREDNREASSKLPETTTLYLSES